MRILLAHNYYGSSAPSGENRVFDAEKALLRDRGHDIAEITRHSDEIRARSLVGAVQGALATAWNPWMAHAVRKMVDSFQPDIVHVHNTFPLISPAIFYAVGHRAARVLTLHNYRVFCPAAIPMRSGHVCMDCLDRRSVLPALQHGCYRGSRLATLPLAANVALHRLLGTWTQQVDAFIALTEFQRKLMIQAGLLADLVHVKPNFFPGSPAIVPWAERRASVVFVGRLSAEKGVGALVRAWMMWGAAAPELRIVGDGKLRGELEGLAASAPLVPIRFLGQLSSAAAQDEVARARLLVLPSECFEGFPMVVREAFAFGTPAAVSNIGPLPSIVRQGANGVLFEAANPASLAQELRHVWCTPGMLEQLGDGARAAFESNYTEDANYRTMMVIYEKAMNRNASERLR